MLIKIKEIQYNIKHLYTHTHTHFSVILSHFSLSASLAATEVRNCPFSSVFDTLFALSPFHQSPLYYILQIHPLTDNLNHCVTHTHNRLHLN